MPIRSVDLGESNILSTRLSGEYCRCIKAELHLASRFNLAVAVVDIHANVLTASPVAVAMLEHHPAFLNSNRRIGLLSHSQSKKFGIGIRRVLSAGSEHMVRADDGCVSAPLGLNLSPWKCPKHCLVSFHPFEPQPTDLHLLASVFDLTPRQIVLLQHFSQGLSLAQIAKQTNLKPQTVREAFSNLYAKFEVRGQLELMSVLAAITYVAAPQGSV
jgi:DNA-binding CsgD family transcriptional regulator